MRSEKRNIEFIEDRREQKEPKTGVLKDFMGGSILTKDGVVKQLPFIIFITLLALIYIGNRYHAEKVVRETVVLQNQVKELRSEAITTSAELMSRSRQSEVTKLLRENELELKELVKPPKRIMIKKD